MESNIYNFYKDITNRHTLNDISTSLGVNKGTIKRWELLKEVPPQYYFDLCRLDGIQVDYKNYTEKEKDQFFTSKDTAKCCYDKCLQVLSEWDVDLSDYTFIEPSAGDGSFFSLFPKERRIGIDIEPRCDDVIQSDFLLWKPTTNKNICLGNPPFGLRGNLALKFINHSAEFSDFVCFVLPQLFDSDGKGSCKSRVKGLNLIHSEVVDSAFYYPDGKDVDVNVVFQIWSKHHQIYEEKIDLSNLIKIYSLSDGGTSGSTRNKKHLYSCDYYLPSTCFGEDCMKIYDDFEELPHRRGYGIVAINHQNNIQDIMNEINWSEVAFPSTNGAFNLRFDIIEKTIWKNLPMTIKELSQSNPNTLESLLY